MSGGNSFEVVVETDGGSIVELYIRGHAKRSNLSLYDSHMSLTNRLMSKEFSINFMLYLYEIGVIDFILTPLMLCIKSESVDEYRIIFYNMSYLPFNKTVGSWEERVFFANFNDFLSEISDRGIKSRSYETTLAESRTIAELATTIESKEFLCVPSTLPFAPSVVKTLNYLMESTGKTYLLLMNDTHIINRPTGIAFGEYTVMCKETVRGIMHGDIKPDYANESFEDYGDTVVYGEGLLCYLVASELESVRGEVDEFGFMDMTPSLPFGNWGNEVDGTEYTYEEAPAPTSSKKTDEVVRKDLLYVIGNLTTLEQALPELSKMGFCSIYCLNNVYYAHVNCLERLEVVYEPVLQEYGVKSKRTVAYLQEYGTLIGSEGESAVILAYHLI